jgi:hypothetical protein
MNAATSMSRPDDQVMPEDGDPTVCIECAAILVYNADTTLRLPHDGELRELKYTDPRIFQCLMRTQCNIVVMNAKRKAKLTRPRVRGRRGG